MIKLGKSIFFNVRTAIALRLCGSRGLGVGGGAAFGCESVIPESFSSLSFVNSVKHQRVGALWFSIFLFNTGAGMSVYRCLRFRCVNL